MPLATRCSVCRKKIGIQEETSLGVFVRCPHCGAEFAVVSIGFSSTSVLPALKATSPQDLGSEVPNLNANSRTLGGEYAKRESFGRFEIRQLLGEGAYGKVYRAFDPLLDREVALKIPKFSDDHERRQERFLREAKAAARLRHPNIVGVHESGRIGEHSYIASEYIDGKPLATLIASGELTFDETAQICAALAEGLAYAHEHGVVHRDIKPGNILMDSEGQPQIADFGLAKRLDEDATMTTEGGILGTPAYMPPEQARGQLDQIGPASDQYSLGVILFEMLTGKRPFEGAPHQIIARVAGADPVPALRSIRSSVPRDLEAICLKSLEKDPRRRYSTTGELAEDLQRWREGRPVRARRASELEYLFRWCKRNPVLSASLVITCGVILAAIGGAFSTVVTKLREAESQVTQEKLRSTASHRQLAINEFERGRNYCERGDLQRGLLWLAQGLERITPEDRDLEYPIRSYIGSWLPLLHQLQQVILHEQPVNTLAFSPDGKWIVTGTGIKNTPGRIRRFDLPDGNPLGEELRFNEGVTSVDVSPDGRFLTIGTWGKTARVVDVSSGKDVFSLDHPASVSCVAYSHDGTRLATGCGDDRVRIWSAVDGSRVGDELHHQGIGRVGSCFGDHHISSVRFGNSDRHLISMTCDGEVRVWNTLDSQLTLGPLVATSSNTIDFLSSLIPVSGTPSEDSPSIYRTSDVLQNNADQFIAISNISVNAARVRRRSDGTVFGQLLSHTSKINHLEFSKDGQYLATGGEDGIVRVWKTGLGSQNVKKIDRSKKGLVRFSPDGQSLYVAYSSRLGKLTQDGTQDADQDWITKWEANSFNVETPPVLFKGGTHCLKFSPDGQLLMRGDWESAHAVDASNCAATAPTFPHPDNVLALEFTPDGRNLITGSHDHQVRFWELSTSRPFGTPTDCSGRVTQLSMSADGVSLLIGCTNGEVRKWNIQENKMMNDKIRHGNALQTLVANATADEFITTGDDGLIRFWSVSTFEASRPPIANTSGNPGHVCYLRDNQRILVSESQFLRLWDTQSGLPASCPYPGSNRVSSVDLHPKDNQLAFASSNGFVRDWRIEDPIMGTPAEVRRNLEGWLGCRFGESGEIVVMNRDEWTSRK